MEVYKEDVVCPKCGHRHIDVIYEGPGTYIFFERMARICTKCGYKWFQKPLDADNHL